MNATITTLPSARPRYAATHAAADREFLPAALEILETPASPVRLALLLLICGLIAFGILWASFGRLDIVATASGKVVPVEQVRAVQSAQPGRLAAIRVFDGDRVREGQVLAVLDDTEVRAQLREQQDALASTEAEIGRRRALADYAPVLGAETNGAVAFSVSWPTSTPTSLIEREDAAAGAELRRLIATLASIEAQITEQDATISGLGATKIQQADLVGTLQQRSSMRQTLEIKQAGSKADALESLGQLQAQQVALSNAEASLQAAVAHRAVLAKSYTQTLTEFESNNQQKLTEALRIADALRERVAQLSAAAGQMVVKSPVAGIVTSSTLKSLGQVVSAAQELMRVVPEGRLQVQAYVPNADIGFVHVGQPVELKVDAFPFTQYGTLKGVVKSVATDAITSAEARESQSGIRDANVIPSAAAASTMGLVYLVTVDLASSANAHDFSIASGMSVSAEVDTGSRTMLSYLLSPFVQTVGNALHER
ncbi:MAG: HlyD family type I secretion periplasmic adaptor subunit [Devosia sp.]